MMSIFVNYLKNDVYSVDCSILKSILCLTDKWYYQWQDDLLSEDNRLYFKKFRPQTDSDEYMSAAATCHGSPTF